MFKYCNITATFSVIIAIPLLILFQTDIVKASTGGKVVGTVVDSKSREPLAGVNVEIIGKAMGAATDIDGDYYILNIPPGIYDIRATMMGYKTVTITGVEVSINHTTETNFAMESTIMELDESVVVIAERPLVERDETSTRHYVAASEIVSRPTTELTQILSTLPSIDVGEGGELLVRLGTLDQVAFLIDGIRARNPLDFEPYTNVNLTAIQELEIITGGFNAEYGEAQSGIFNIVTKDGSNQLEGYAEVRWTPPGIPHWGTAFYDYNTDRYWENSNARHLQWWIDNPNQWVDPAGTPGSDPNCAWTPEEAYADYMATHQALNDYTNQSGYQTEISLGGPLFSNDLFFFISGKYRSMPPVTGNTYRNVGSWFDGTAKLTFHLNTSMKLMLFGVFGTESSNQGMEYMDTDWIGSYGLESKYAYYDFAGYPEYRVNGQTLEFTHSLDQSNFYQVKLNRFFRHKSQWTFPGDEDGWETGVPQYDYVRARDEFGNPIVEGYNNVVGLHTDGYYYRNRDENTDWTISADLTSQVKKSWQLKAGGDFTYYVLKRFQDAKAFAATEDDTYNPYEGNIYAQTKLEFESLIMNLGLRYDFYNSNDEVYLNFFDPFDTYGALVEDRAPNPDTEPTSTFGQLSPRIGISHPISVNTVLHFSYGHFFQRSNFGDYGEGYQVSGLLNNYQIAADTEYPVPYNLGNRNLVPRKTVAYEVGIEHNLGDIVIDLTGFYKDITKTVRSIRVFTYSGARYLTAGNGDYADAKGIEISIRKPLSNYWGGYLNYAWSTGISGRSGDPDVIAPPGSSIQVGEVYNIGDVIQYFPSRLKFGITVSTPFKYTSYNWLLGGWRFAIDYSVYYPHSRIGSHVFSEGGKSYLREADKNANIRLRKEFNLNRFRPAIFIEILNAFNNVYTNVDVVESYAPEDRVAFVNSRFTEFPDRQTNGAPFPDVVKYRNLPRRIYFGISINF
jgi:outer membrane receptor for ferrienterochelin and colicin